MATKQYIGARYVPVIMGDWTAGVAYEPLSIVTYLNNSYTSKKQVPASIGNPAANPEYWVSTGIYNAQVAEIRQQIDDVAADVSEERFRKRHIIIIADSYGTYDGAGSTFTLSYNILDRLVTYTGWESSYIHYSAQNGAGFCNGLYQSQFEALAVSDPEAVKDIYFLGGWNDESGREGVSASAFNSAADAIRLMANNEYPNANLHLCFAAWSYQDSRNQNNLRTTLGWYRELEKRGGWILEENYQYVMHRSDYLIGGNVHPNQNGVDALAAALGQIILNGECHVAYEVTCPVGNITLPGTLPASSGLTLYQQLRDGVAFVELYTQRGCITLDNAASLALDGAHTIELFTYTGPTIVKGTTNRIGAACSVSFLNNGTRYTVPGYIVFADGSCKFFPDYYPEGSSYLSLNNITKVTIPKCQFAVKAW